MGAKDIITFIDVFCGIGGMRMAFEAAGAKCVWSCDNDIYANQTYKANFDEDSNCDIRTKNIAEIPAHDILVGGFPCQSFSNAGVSKRNSLGRPHGFEDKDKGDLIFKIFEILKEHKPAAFLLENVKNLIHHDKGKTLRVILDGLNEAGYNVIYELLDASCYVPQRRKRIFLVGFRKDLPGTGFEFPQCGDERKRLVDIIEENVPDKYTLSDRMWNGMQRHMQNQNEKGNGFGFGIANLDGLARTLCATYYKGGSEILIPQENKNPRRLTPRECARLMGFPETFKIVCSDSQAYKQFGNSVAVPLVTDIAINLFNKLKEYFLQKRLDL